MVQPYDPASLDGLWWAAVGPCESDEDVTEGYVALGGQSLAAARFVATVGERFGVQLPLTALLRDNVSLADVRRIMADTVATSRETVPDKAAATRLDRSPLAPSQHRLWSLSSLHPGAAAYNVVVAFRLHGTVHLDALRGALHDVVRRHDALRARVTGSPLELRYSDDVRIDLAVEEAGGALTDSAVDVMAHRVAGMPIPMDRAPMMRTALLRSADGDDACLVLSLHHIIADQASVTILLDDLGRAYRKRLAGEPAELSPAPSFAEHAIAETAEQSSPAWRDDLRYWRELLGSAPEPPALPWRQTGTPSFAGASHDVSLNSARIDAFLRAHTLTPAAFVLGVLVVVLARWGDTERVVVGTPASRRRTEADHQLVGFFMETLALPVDLGAAADLLGVLHQVRDRYLDAFSHSTPTFDAVVGELDLPARPFGSPLFQVWFNDLTQGTSSLVLPGVETAFVDVSDTAALFDLNIYLHRDADGLRLRLVRATDRVPASVAEQLLDQCLRVVEHVLADPAAHYRDVPLAAVPGALPVPLATTTTWSLAGAGHDPAIVTQDSTITYLDLETAVAGLAGRLAAAGVAPGRIAEIRAVRSPGLAVALLATWRTGGVAAPVDTAAPDALLERQHTALGPTAVLDVAAGTTVVVRDGVAEPRELPGASHVLFTSGTGGHPAGVVVAADPLGTALAWYAELVAPTAADRFVLTAGLGHDPVLRDLLVPLSVGASVMVPPGDVLTDPAALPRLLAERRITVLHATPALLQLLVAAHAGAPDVHLTALRMIVSAGAPLTAGLVRRVRELTGAAIVNAYGTTETPQTVACWPVLSRAEPADPALSAFSDDDVLPIGHGVAGNVLRVRTGTGLDAGVYEPGEVVVVGAGLAERYLGGDRPLRTEIDGVPAFRTGDIGRREPGGVVRFLGRRDRQVDIDGHRTDLTDIEAETLRDPAVGQAVAGLTGSAAGPVLAIQVVPVPGGYVDVDALRGRLATYLPRHAVPAVIDVRDRLLTNANHKAVFDETARPLTVPTDDTERWLTGLLGDILGRPVGPEEHFFEAGLTSMQLLRLHATLTEQLDGPLPPTALFEHPTARSVATMLAGVSAGQPGQRPASDDPIAVIGMAGRFPGAASVDELWLALCEGREMLRFPADEELLAAGLSRSTLADPAYVRAVAEPSDVDLFDAGLFGLTPKDARTSDPQLRVFLETSHAAVEHAGYDPATLGDAGVFGATGENQYVRLYLGGSVEEMRSTSGMAVGSWNKPGSLATMVSYKLGFTGPSMTVQTACSSSLVAVHQAVNAIRNGECGVALAGGVEVQLPLTHGYWWQQDGPLSRDGHCRPFDAAATGTVFGSGAGVVVLKRLSQAIADGDQVHAVIRGTAVNNDGARRVGFTAPGVAGQTSVIMAAMSAAGVAAADIGLVEAHGTGTVLGDPIEVAALSGAYRQLGHRGTGSAALTSVKANVGHLGHAAGVTSLIRAVLSLARETITPGIGVSAVNPRLELADSPFYLPAAPTPWPRTEERPRYAAVSSLGIGGTNAHVVLAEAPPRPLPPTSARPRIVVWSGRTPAARDAYRSRLGAWFGDDNDAGFAACVDTLQLGRHAYPVRGAVVAANVTEAAVAIDSPAAVLGGGDPRGIAFLLPGQGAQHAGMAHDLYEHEPTFAAALDEVLHLLADAGLPVTDPWRSATDDELAATALAQPLLFAVEYALARLWREWGVIPDVLLGHSIGELSAAAIAEVFTLPDAVRLVVARARAMSRMPSGGMLAVAAAADELAGELPSGVELAAVNGPHQVVIAGPEDALAAFSPTRGQRTRPVRTAHAFHTQAMRAAAAEFATAFEHVTARPPRIPVYSAATGDLMTPQQAMSPAFWADQLVSPVLFGPALERLLAAESRVLVEVGPGRTLTALSRGQTGVTDGTHLAVASLPARLAAPPAERVSVLNALATVWTAGHDVDWLAVRHGEPVARTAVPGYPYQRERYWPDPVPAEPVAPPPVTPAPPPATTPVVVPESLLSVPGWAESTPPAQVGTEDRGVTHAVLLAEDDTAAELVLAVHRAGLKLLPVPTGDGIAYHLPRRHADRLGDLLRGPVSCLVVAWPMSDTGSAADKAEAALASFDELYRVAQLVARLPAGTAPDRLVVLSRGAVDVSGAEPVRAEAALLPPLARTLADEQPELAVTMIDVGAGAGPDEIAEELARPAGEPVVALRGDRRWIPSERPFTPTRGNALRRHGVYLVTGGTGGLGIEVARGLASTGEQPVLVLVGTTRTVATPVLDELAALGATVEVSTCDISDPVALASLVDAVTTHHGPVNGVLHLAGRPGTGMVRFAAADGTRATFAPKVRGALAIQEVFTGRPRLDFLVLFSSRAALEGQEGGADYAAANAFLDVFASTTTLDAHRVLSIDWPAWQGAGMAGEAVFRGRAGDRPGTRRWQAVLTAADDPVTDEHRRADVPVMPGTRHIDLVIDTFRQAVLDGADVPVRLTDVVFQQTLELAAPRRVEIAFAPDADGWTFTVQSAPPATSAPTDVLSHVRGQIAAWHGEPDDTPVDLTELGERLTVTRERPQDTGDRNAFTLGPRWQVLEGIRSDPAGDELLLTLALPAAYEAEAAEHPLHPTLMDAATTSVRDEEREAIHLPFLYRSMVVRDRLPSRVYSHLRRRPDAAANSIVADLDVLAPDGRTLVEVRGFTMRRLVGTAEPSSAAPGQTGLPPATGVALLLSLLGGRTPRQVAVRRSHAVATPSRTAVAYVPPVETRAPEPVPEPAVTPEPEPDETDLATQVKQLWMETIGMADIGAEQDFFDLGGNSLTAVGLMAQIQEQFGVDLSIGAIFDYPTLDEFTAELARLTAGR